MWPFDRDERKERKDRELREFEAELSREFSHLLDLLDQGEKYHELCAFSRKMALQSDSLREGLKGERAICGIVNGSALLGAAAGGTTAFLTLPSAMGVTTGIGLAYGTMLAVSISSFGAAAFVGFPMACGAHLALKKTVDYKNRKKMELCARFQQKSEDLREDFINNHVEALAKSPYMVRHLADYPEIKGRIDAVIDEKFRRSGLTDVFHQNAQKFKQQALKEMMDQDKNLPQMPPLLKLVQPLKSQDIKPSI